MLTPAVAGCAVFMGTLTWGSRPRLYAYARCRGLRCFYWHVNLGLAPQALCLRPLSRAALLLAREPGARAPGFMLTPAVAGCADFIGTLTWGSRPRLYAYARCRGLRCFYGHLNLGLAPQALCLRPLSRAALFLLAREPGARRPRLYAYARCRGLRVLFQFPDAFCNFDFLHLAESPIVTILVRHTFGCGHLAVMWLDILSA